MRFALIVKSITVGENGDKFFELFKLYRNPSPAGIKEFSFSF